MQFAASADVRSGRQRLDFLGRHVGVGGVKVHRVNLMRRSPFEESFRIGGDRNRGRILYALEVGVEHRPRERGEGVRERTELSVEIAKKQQGLVDEYVGSRIVNLD